MGGGDIGRFVEPDRHSSQQDLQKDRTAPEKAPSTEPVAKGRDAHRPDAEEDDDHQQHHGTGPVGELQLDLSGGDRSDPIARALLVDLRE